MAPRVGDQLDAANLEVVAGRIISAAESPDALELDVALRAGGVSRLRASHVINCTGPTTDVDLLSSPIVADGLAHGLLRRDPLGLGIETSACATIATDGHASDWLFAIGSLTRPEFWEVAAVPEILAQGRALAERLSAADMTRRYGI